LQPLKEVQRLEEEEEEYRRKEDGAFLMSANDIVFTNVPSNRMEF
jgi:hypothetical protein